MTEIKISRCRSCGAPVLWAETAKGRLCPYDVVDGVPTETSHFSTCPQASQWSKKAKKA